MWQGAPPAQRMFTAPITWGGWGSWPFISTGQRGHFLYPFQTMLKFSSIVPERNWRKKNCSLRLCYGTHLVFYSINHVQYRTNSVCWGQIHARFALKCFVLHPWKLPCQIFYMECWDPLSGTPVLSRWGWPGAFRLLTRREERGLVPRQREGRLQATCDEEE